MIRECRDEDFDDIWAIVNDGARAYRGVIPEDRWHEPYMTREQLRSEIEAGVHFWGFEDSGRLVGVMALQDVKDVTLIRHAYVITASQRSGIGGKLMTALVREAQRPLLVGTWAAAEWAIRFYERNGFRLVGPEEKDRLLSKYWSIPDRQRETSVVLVQAL